jgi:endonuclease YncB( thermonuclease family)
MPRPSFAALLAVMLLPIGASGQTVVVDGDTLKLDGQRIRLHGIDAPELHQACDAGAWHPGPLARDALVALIAGQPVECQPIDRDRYGRTVARCYAGGEDLGRAMVQLSMAWAFVRYSRDYFDQEAQARAENLGVHAYACLFPWDWRAQHR